MKVFIANFGQENYLWPKCLKRGTVATINNVGAQPFWERRDRQGHIAYAIAHLKTARGEVPSKPVASRWFTLMDFRRPLDSPRQGRAMVDDYAARPGPDRAGQIV